MELAVEQFLGKSEDDVKVSSFSDKHCIITSPQCIAFLIMGQCCVKTPPISLTNHEQILLKATLLHTLEGHFRAILSTLTVEVLPLTLSRENKMIWSSGITLTNTLPRECIVNNNSGVLMRHAENGGWVIDAQRIICSTLQEINGDRIKFAKLVSEMASPDLGRWEQIICPPCEH